MSYFNVSGRKIFINDRLLDKIPYFMTLLKNKGRFMDTNNTNNIIYVSRDPDMLETILKYLSGEDLIFLSRETIREMNFYCIEKIPEYESQFMRTKLDQIEDLDFLKKHSIIHKVYITRKYRYLCPNNIKEHMNTTYPKCGKKCKYAAEKYLEYEKYQVLFFPFARIYMTGTEDYD